MSIAGDLASYNDIRANADTPMAFTGKGGRTAQHASLVSVDSSDENAVLYWYPCISDSGVFTERGGLPRSVSGHRHPFALHDLSRGSLT